MTTINGDKRVSNDESNQSVLTKAYPRWIDLFFVSCIATTNSCCQYLILFKATRCLSFILNTATRMPFAGIIGFGHDTRAHLLDEEHMRVQEEFVVNNGGDDEIRQSPYECDSVCNPAAAVKMTLNFTAPTIPHRAAISCIPIIAKPTSGRGTLYCSVVAAAISSSKASPTLLNRLSVVKIPTIPIVIRQAWIVFTMITARRISQQPPQHLWPCSPTTTT